jgi:cytochrome P450
VAPHPPDAKPAGPKDHPVYGGLSRYHDDPIAFLEHNAAAYGDVSAFRFFHLPVWQLNHPDDVRRVLIDPEGTFTKGITMESFRPLLGKGLLVAEGETHRRQKRLMVPAFHRTALAGYNEEMVSAARRVAASWTDGQRVDMDLEMNRLALGVAARTLFGTGLSDAEYQHVAEAVSGFVQWYHQSTHPLGPLLQHLPTRATRAFAAGRRRLSGVIERIVAERRQSPGADILSRLLSARDLEGDSAAMSPEHVHDEAITLLIAGHETTGATLAWAWHLMALHPDTADRLAAEVRAAVGDAPPDGQDLPKLSYARWIFAEALRLYPPAIALPRQAQRSVVLGGYTAPEGTLVMVATWCAHRDARWWDAPLEFRPERWDPARSSARPRFAYFPFGGGSRACIGEEFAWNEGALVLATLAQRWRAKGVPGPELRPEALFTVRPRGGLPMVVEARLRID